MRSECFLLHPTQQLLGALPTPYMQLVRDDGHRYLQALLYLLHQPPAVQRCQARLETRRMIQALEYWSDCEWHGTTYPNLWREPPSRDRAYRTLFPPTLDIPQARDAWRTYVDARYDDDVPPHAHTIEEWLYEFLHNRLNLEVCALYHQCARLAAEKVAYDAVTQGMANVSIACD
jgi:hypothetical protein